MSSIVQVSDFTGFHYIAVNASCQTKLQEYIDRYEYQYLCFLLGETVTPLFLAEVAGFAPPTTADYLTIYNKFCEVLPTYECSQTELMHSKGLKEALIGLIFYHFVSNDNYKHTLTGVVQNKNENSEQASAVNVERFSEKRWNEAVESFNAIACKVVELDLYKYPVELNYKLLDLV